VAANIGAGGSFVFYDALLPHVARDDELDRVSASGYALGYVGGGLLLALNLAWIQKPEWFGLPSGPGLSPAEATLPTRLAFLSVAAWWAAFAVPLFLRVREPAVVAHAGPHTGLMREAFTRLAATARDLGRFRQALLMMVAFLIYADGIGTVIRMSTSYGESIGIGTGTMIAALVATQFAGIPFAILFGWLSRRVPARRLILVGLGVYVVICVLGSLMSTDLHFVLLALLVASVQGGTQALSRSLFASLIPRQRSGEFFGFFAVAEKFAGLLGPLTFGLTVTLTGSVRLSILAVIAFFVAGGLVLSRVDVAAGRAQARRAEADLEAARTVVPPGSPTP
jgi:UMF1 family MFS transporter